MKQLLIALSIASIAAAQTYTYDAAGRLTTVAYPGGGGVRYTYDASDNLTAVTPLNLPPAPSGIQLSRESASSNRVSWQAVSGATGYIVERRVLGSDAWTELARLGGGVLFYADSAASTGVVYAYRIAALNTSGRSGYSVEVNSSPDSAVDPRSSHRLSLSSGAAQSLMTTGTAAATSSGYATVSLDSGESPYGIAVFKLTQNGVIVSEAGVPATPPSRSTRVFIDYRTGVASASNQYTGRVDFNTGVGLVNTNLEEATVRFTLRSTAGQVIASGSGSLAGGAHIARVINELNAVAPDFRLPTDFPTATRFGSLDVESSLPLSVMALRVTVNQRNELLFSTTPVVDLNVPAPNTLVYFAHLPEGGGFTTALFLMSSSASAQTGRIDFFDDGGAPFIVRPVGGQASASLNYAIPPGGSFVLETDGARPTVGSGWARLTPAAGQTSPFGAGSFRYAQGGIVTAESGIATAEPTTQARIYVDTTGGHDTGLAIANPGASTAGLTLRAYGTDGATPAGTGSANVDLAAGGHLARVAGAFISGLPAGFTGVLEVSSATPIVALTVRSLFNARNELLFTTFPVADLMRPAPSPVIFPHIADGGGFQTELILISPRGGSSVTVRYLGDDGKPLNVARQP